MAAFPQEERRDQEYHLETMSIENFHFDVVVDGDSPIGIVAWWEFEEWRFIEHFATHSSLRGQGYGAKILTEFASESEKPIILEVEHPTEEICRRRIEFYRRLGFVLNDHHYEHPSYQQKEGEVVSLMIMSYPEPISSSQLSEYVAKYLPVIHFRNF